MTSRTLPDLSTRRSSSSSSTSSERPRTGEPAGLYIPTILTRRSPSSHLSRPFGLPQGNPFQPRSPHEPYRGSRRRSSNFGSYQKTAKSHWLLRLHGSHCFLCSPPLPPRRRSSLPPRQGLGHSGSIPPFCAESSASLQQNCSHPLPASAACSSAVAAHSSPTVPLSFFAFVVCDLHLRSCSFLTSLSIPR